MAIPFTARAEGALKFARDEALRLRYEHLGTEHFLIAVLRDDAAAAVRVLSDLGVNVEEVRSNLHGLLTPRAGKGGPEPLPLTPSCQRALDLAVKEAAARGHPFLTTAHLLLGLAREEEGIASNLLIDHRCNKGLICDKMLTLFAEAPETARDERSAAPFMDLSPIENPMPRTVRRPDELRPFSIELGFSKFAAGSALVRAGDTKILVTASVEESVPPFLKDKGQGWITSEYAMLPGSTSPRKSREGTKGRPDGRTFEIQRLIGRSLRAVFDLKALGERSVWVDCDVIQADGGTRTASITGAYVAVAVALRGLKARGILPAWPFTSSVAAVSVGKTGGGELVLDLDYAEDSKAEVDFNVVMDGQGRYIEVQGTAERGSFSETELAAFLALARKGIRDLTAIQEEVLRSVP